MEMESSVCELYHHPSSRVVPKGQALCPSTPPSIPSEERSRADQTVKCYLFSIESSLQVNRVAPGNGKGKTPLRHLSSPVQAINPVSDSTLTVIFYYVNPLKTI